MNAPDNQRVGDIERDSVTTVLREHFAQGRLTREELDERLDATLTASTAGDLRAITRDLPATEPVRLSRPRHHHRHPPIGLFVIGAIVMALVMGGPWAFFAVLKVMFVVVLVGVLLRGAHHRRAYWRSRPLSRNGQP